MRRSYRHHLGDVTVRDAGDTYTARGCHGIGGRASCTVGPVQAVQALLRKRSIRLEVTVIGERAPIGPNAWRYPIYREQDI